MKVEYVAGDVNYGYTTPAQLTQWLSLAGFTEVIDRTVTEASDPPVAVLANSRLPDARSAWATQNRVGAEKQLVGATKRDVSGNGGKE